MIEIETVVESEDWLAAFGADVSAFAVATIERGLAADPILAALLTVGERAGALTLTALFTRDSKLQDLNLEWRGRDEPTNILSFPGDWQTLTKEGVEARLKEVAKKTLPPIHIGDLALGLETIRAEAEAQGKSRHDHLRHLLLHGTLHLLGYDHELAGEAERMEALEVRLLADFGVANPYLETFEEHDFPNERNPF